MPIFFWGGAFPVNLMGYSAPEFECVAQAYVIPAHSLVNMDESRDAFAWNKRLKGTSLLQVILDQKTDLYLKVKFGALSP